MLNDPLLTAYVDSVGQHLAKKSRRPNLTYHFRIVDSPVINAFALPGGYIYIHRGLLDLLQSESELAGVLGHEIGHMAARHGANMVSRRLIAEHLLGEGAKLAGLNPQDVGKTLQSLGGPVPLFIERPLNQEDELQADRMGVYRTSSPLSMLPRRWALRGRE